MNYSKTLTFAEQDLRPAQIIRLWSPLDKDDPRKAECNADLALLSIEDWRLKWCPNLNYQISETTKGTSALDQVRAQLTVLSRQLTRDFNLNDPKYQERLAKNMTMKIMMGVKTGGDQRIAKDEAGAASIDQYLRLILKKPYVSVAIGAYQLQTSTKLEWQVGRAVEGLDSTVMEVFPTLALAKERVYGILSDLQTQGFF